MNTHHWHCRDHRFTITHRALVMGIVNVTPDSFSDGGTYHGVEHGLRLVAEGADILDIGGESTRPGATPVSLDEELSRVLPVVRELAKSTQIPLSIDTTKAIVARACLEAGASIINDISGLTFDSEMVAVVRDFQAGVVVMHMQGTPQTMQIAPSYGDVIAEVTDFLESRLHSLADQGISPSTIALDPGIGFGKLLDHTLTQLARLSEFQRLGRPICLGVSRKGFIGQITGRARNERMAGSVAVVCHGLANGAVQIARVHDVAATCDAVKIIEAINQSRI